MMNEELDDAQVDVSAGPVAKMNDELFEEMHMLRERIKARRGGELITDDVVEQVRAERDEELLGMAACLQAIKPTQEVIIVPRHRPANEFAGYFYKVRLRGLSVIER